MDLNIFANKLRNDLGEQPDLLPKQQTNRSYNDVEEKLPSLNIGLEKFQYGEKNGRMLLTMSVVWPQFDTQKSTATQKQLEKFARDWLISNSNIGLKDYKYVKIVSVNKNQIVYEWDIDSWFNTNFRSKPIFSLPSTFKFKYKESIPTVVQSRIHEVELKSFISDKFKQWLNKNGRMKLIKHENFNFVSKLIPDLFQYVIDYKTSEIRVSLKQSVAIAGLVTALMIKNKNKFTKKEKAQIEKELSKISSVKNINKFV